jgi:hypothetical protein
MLHCLAQVQSTEHRSTLDVTITYRLHVFQEYQYSKGLEPFLHLKNVEFGTEAKECVLNWRLRCKEAVKLSEVVVCSPVSGTAP